MKKIARYILMAAACLVMWQCGPDNPDNPDNPDDPPVNPDPEIHIIGSSEFDFNEDGGKCSFTFTSATDWTATPDDGWLHVNQTAGSGSEFEIDIDLTCDANLGEEPRTGTVTIAAGPLEEKITVTQAERIPEGPKSSECVLTALNFVPSVNPTLSSQLSYSPRNIRGYDIIFVTFPDGADMTSMIPHFEVSKKATVYVGEEKIVNGKTPVDFTKNEPWTVVAEDGEHSMTYMMMARRGIPAIDRKIYSFLGTYSIPAVGLAVTRNGQIVYAAGYGLADAGNDPVFCTETHLFRLASVSKTLTSICILRLCQEGRLSLDDKVFAPGGPLADMFPGTHASRVDDIKVRDLLTHRSGWTNSNIGDDPIFPYTSRFASIRTLKERVATVVKNNSPAYTPGTTYSYSNLGFCVLGLVIEQVTGKGYETYLREVTAMAGANDIWVSKNARNQKRDNECVFYAQDGAYPYDNDMTISAACGGITASAMDMARILNAIDYGTNPPDILEPEWLDKMYTNYTSSYPGGYGFGWWIGHGTLTNWATYHTGSLSGTATLWVRGKNGVSGVILCNSRNYKSSFDTDMYLALDNAMTRILE
ncbi:MAG: serine hydrolase [Bacteroidales bacterium]|nr:serine hydrolase [Bacteroidales bacterium]